MQLEAHFSNFCTGEEGNFRSSPGRCARLDYRTYFCAEVKKDEPLTTTNNKRLKSAHEIVLATSIDLVLSKAEDLSLTIAVRKGTVK